MPIPTDHSAQRSAQRGRRGEAEGTNGERLPREACFGVHHGRGRSGQGEPLGPGRKVRLWLRRSAGNLNPQVQRPGNHAIPHWSPFDIGDLGFQRTRKLAAGLHNQLALRHATQGLHV